MMTTLSWTRTCINGSRSRNGQRESADPNRRGLEHELGLSNANVVSVDERVLLDSIAIHERAVLRFEVFDAVGGIDDFHYRVAARNVRGCHLDVVVRRSADEVEIAETMLHRLGTVGILDQRC